MNNVKTERIDNFFNIYYLNLPKVYELSMMINNVIITSLTTKKKYKKSFNISSDINSKFLISMKSLNTSSEAIKENFDVKTTKSILLKRVMERCKFINDFKSLNTGDLIFLNNVHLNLVDEQMIRFISTLRRDALKNFIIEKSNNIKVGDVSPMLEDYGYILEGMTDEGENFIIKIPCEINNEFENKYNINDIIIGKVSIIGIYKGDIEKEAIKKNTFKYLLENSHLLNEDFNNKSSNIESSSYKKDINKQNKNTLNESDKCQYIDIIGIIQNINFWDLKEKKKIGFFGKLKNFFKSRNIDR